MAKSSMYFQLREIDGKWDAKELKRELDAFPGVISVSVNTERDRLCVDFDDSGADARRLAKRVEKLGYHIAEQASETHLM